MFSSVCRVFAGFNVKKCRLGEDLGGPLESRLEGSRKLEIRCEWSEKWEQRLMAVCLCLRMCMCTCVFVCAVSEVRSENNVYVYVYGYVYVCVCVYVYVYVHVFVYERK